MLCVFNDRRMKKVSYFWLTRLRVWLLKENSLQLTHYMKIVMSWCVTSECPISSIILRNEYLEFQVAVVVQGCRIQTILFKATGMMYQSTCLS